MSVMPEPLLIEGGFTFREPLREWVLRHVKGTPTIEMFQSHVVVSSDESPDEWHIALDDESVQFISGDVYQFSAINVPVDWIINTDGDWVASDETHNTSMVSMVIDGTEVSRVRWANGDSLTQTIDFDTAKRTLTRDNQRTTTLRLWSGPIEVSPKAVIFDRAVVASRTSADYSWSWVNPHRRDAWLRLLHAAFPDRQLDAEGVPHV